MPADEPYDGWSPDLLPAPMSATAVTRLPSPAVLNHGDLWRNNIIADAAGDPVFIDPAVCWMWAEADLSMAYCAGGIPDRFFDAYHELRPPVDGWRDRMRLLNLRELLSVLAHFGPRGDTAEQVRDIVKRFG